MTRDARPFRSHFNPTQLAVLSCVVGLFFATLVTIHCQVMPRLQSKPGTVFHGAPQGEDELVYFALARAVWRAGNGFTYCYPFALKPMPPVLLQLPIALLAAIGRVSGLPWAFEVGRVLGAAVTAGLLAVLCCLLEPRRRMRGFLIITIVASGGICAWFALVPAIQIAGVAGLTDLFAYVPRAGGSAYNWLPYIAQNVVYPLECIYHALMLGTLVCVLGRKPAVSALLILVLWFSNPFTAVAASCAVLPWLIWRAVENAKYRLTLLLWIVAVACGACYYALFLQQWPELADIVRRHRLASSSRARLSQLAAIWLPWILGLFWSIASASGRHHIWMRPKWRLFAILAVTQLALSQQQILLGADAAQPFHYNRGYLQLALVLITWRMLVVSFAAARARRMLIALLCFTLPDQVAFFSNFIFYGVDAAYVDGNYARLATAIPENPAPQLVLTDLVRDNAYISGCTPHIPYKMPEGHMLVPFGEQREWELSKQLNGGNVAALGIGYAIINQSSPFRKPLEAQQWTHVGQSGDMLLLRAPTENRGTSP